MAMILTLDNLGKRYGMLPSQALCHASTFDLFIMDAALSFEHDARKDPSEPPNVAEEELLKILEKSRGN
jgi:hypothetical protein